MGYIDENLMSNEDVVGRAYLHWVVYISAIVWLVVGVLLIATIEESGWLPGGLCILIALAAALVAFINQKTSEFGVTNKRVLLKTGLIRRNSFATVVSRPTTS